MVSLMLLITDGISTDLLCKAISCICIKSDRSKEIFRDIDCDDGIMVCRVSGTTHLCGNPVHRFLLYLLASLVHDG